MNSTSVSTRCATDRCTSSGSAFHRAGRRRRALDLLPQVLELGDFGDGEPPAFATTLVRRGRRDAEIWRRSASATRAETAFVLPRQRCPLRMSSANAYGGKGPVTIALTPAVPSRLERAPVAGRRRTRNQVIHVATPPRFSTRSARTHRLTTGTQRFELGNARARAAARAEARDCKVCQAGRKGLAFAGARATRQTADSGHDTDGHLPAVPTCTQRSTECRAPAAG